MTRLIALIVTQYANNIYNITQVKEMVKKIGDGMKEDELRTKIKKLISLEEKRQIYITYSALECL